MLCDDVPCHLQNPRSANASAYYMVCLFKPVYPGDSLLCAKTLEQELIHLKIVWDKLKIPSLKVNPKNCVVSKKGNLSEVHHQ